MARKASRSTPVLRAKSSVKIAKAAKPTKKKNAGGKVAGKPTKQPRDKGAVFGPTLKAQAAKVIRSLEEHYGGAVCALEHASAFQLLVATILSAQCTDERVNIVTKDLFKRWPTAADLAAVPIPVLEKAIQSTGFFRNKAKNIKAASRELVEKYDGQVPRDMDQLVALAGVGRKTANVVLGTAYGIPTGVVVDTHVTRLSNRLGLTQHTDPVKIEQDLIEIVPKNEWIDFSHRLIHHGRQICVARKPKCDICPMNKFCPKIGVEA